MIITLDFETYYDQAYSLRKMTTVDYVLSPLFQTIMCSIKIDHHPTVVHLGEEATREALAAIDWSSVALLSHNTQFDGCILAWRYGFVPRLYLDTLSMARALTHATIGRSSLEAIANYFNMPPKGTAIMRAMGKRFEDFAPHELEEYADYCAHDTDLCRAIFDRFVPKFPRSELALIDLNLRLFIQPQATLDPIKLAEALAAVRAEKAQAIASVSHIPKDTFSSNIKFADLLALHGVAVPMKTSPTTGMEIPALARNDRAFKELCEDEQLTPVVKALLAARMGVKSTIDETRAEVMLNLSLKDWAATPLRPGEAGTSNMGWMPVPYRYYGAHTGRFSGDGGYNFANLRRGSPIRDAIAAPPGKRIVHRDSSQIEARVNAWMSGCRVLLDAFAEGRDIYSEFATEIYGYSVTKADKLERFVGKTSILGLGYGMGFTKFRHTLFIGQGGVSADVPDGFAADVVTRYRHRYSQIPRLWANAARMLEAMIAGAQLDDPRVVGVFETHDDIPGITPGVNAVWLPNGLCIAYPGLRFETVSTSMGPRRQIGYTGTNNQLITLHGGKAVENFCQALARIVVTDISLRVKQVTGYHPVMMTYDSLDYCVAEAEAEAMDSLLEAQFAIRPAWASDLPLASEGGWGRTLAEAEKGVNT